MGETLRVPRMSMADVLFVSKPVAPPWNDGSKNLARDVAGHLRKHRATVMVHRGQDPEIEGVRTAPVYRAGARVSFAPGRRDHLDVFRYLSFGPRRDLWHFFFGANRRSARAGRLVSTFRRTACVHTLCSVPDEGTSLRDAVFADVTIALSKQTYERLRASGLSSAAIRRIPPSVRALERPSNSARQASRVHHGLPADARIWIYPGDLEHGRGGELTIRALAASGRADDLLVMACRDKTPSAAHARRELRELGSRLGLGRRIRWVGESPHILDLLAASDFVVLPSDTSFAKIDYPMVALEAMRLGRPVLVGAGTPAEELAEHGAALAADPDPEAIATAIETCAADSEVLDMLVERAVELTSNELSANRVAEQYERLYDEMHA